MRSEILAGLIVVALCACGTAAERPEPFSRGDILIASAGDPNEAIPPAGADPNKTWDPAAHLAADWESISVSMTSRLYNPAVRPSVEPEGPQWSMSLTSTLDIVDSNGLIGLGNAPTSVLALDQDGAVVISSTSGSPLVRWYQQPRPRTMAEQTSSVFPMNRVSLNLPIDPNATYPEMFSRVEWTMNVLVAREIKTVDIPFKVSETWAEVTPGMEVLVEQATVEEGKYQYRFKVKYDRTKVEYLMTRSVSLWRDQQPPAAAVLEIDVLNAEGKSIHDLGAGGFSEAGSYSGPNNQITGTLSGSGSCETCGEAATVRYTLAFDMYELEARFALENVPVPEF